MEWAYENLFLIVARVVAMGLGGAIFFRRIKAKSAVSEPGTVNYGTVQTCSRCGGKNSVRARSVDSYFTCTHCGAEQKLGQTLPLSTEANRAAGSDQQITALRASLFPHAAAMNDELRQVIKEVVTLYHYETKKVADEINLARRNNPGRMEFWYWDKVRYQIKRDRDLI